ncbi:DNA polymerase III subunit alpha, partial [bacterium]|nr:DNA polymerase III subunit alpha [bacterium]
MPVKPTRRINEAEFVHLHLHSYYSLLDGSSSPDELVDRAVMLGFKSLALTDHNNLHGAIPFYDLCQQAGIKPIIGAELTLNKQFHTTVLCRNMQGYRNLCALITLGQLKGGSPENFDLKFEELAELKEGLFILSGCSRGEIPALLSQGESQLARITAQRYREAFGEYFYLELQYHPTLEASRLYHKIILLSNSSGVPPVATNNVHFARTEDHICHRVLTSIREGTTIHDGRPERFAPPDFYLKSKAEMGRIFEEIPEALLNTARIAGQCNLDLQLSRLKFPRFSLKPEETAPLKLAQLAFRGLERKYSAVTPEIEERARFELDIIRKLGFSDYFLVVWDIVKFAKSQGIPVVARGSAANSIVTYALGISNVDPLAQNLLFERFLNLSRTDPPDIDIDLCWKGRDQILKYVYDKYGHDRVAMISTFTTMRHRSCFREVAKVYGIAQGKVNFFSKRIPYFNHGTLYETVSTTRECQVIPFQEEPFSTIIFMADRLAKIPRHLGIHCGGIVISPEPITHFVPLQRAAKGIAITQFDMFSIEKIGLVKIDLLGQRALTILRETVEAVKDNYGHDIDLDRVEKDPATEETLTRGQTLGCFQIESPGMRQLLQMMGACTVNDLTIALSLIRPGPAEAGMKREYVEFRRGLKKVEYLHPILKKILGETYGIMLYQEDTIRVTAALADFSLEEGDFLRRAMTKRRHHEKIERLKAKFFKGARKKGIPLQTIETVWERINHFMSYSFCKSHAATYAVIAYQAAYLKTHFPVEYMAAVLSNHAGFYSTEVYLQEARRLGLEIMLPDINLSEQDFRTSKGKIRIGLGRVKGLSQRVMNQIFKERKGRPFSSLADFLHRVKITQSETESLIRAGAFDFMNEERSSLLWKLELIHQDFSKWWHDNSLALQNLQLPPTAEIRCAYKLSQKQKILMEYATLELFPRGHPFELVKGPGKKSNILTSIELYANINKHVSLLGYLIASRTIRTRSGESMKFLTFQDEKGTFEAVLSGNYYQRYAECTIFRDVFLVQGTVQDQYGALNIKARHILSLKVFADLEYDPVKCS